VSRSWMTKRASDDILDRLRTQAAGTGKPDVRNATIDRLVEACNAIESGAAADLCKRVFGNDGGLRFNPTINPSTIDRYVLARKNSEVVPRGVV